MKNIVKVIGILSAAFAVAVLFDTVYTFFTAHCKKYFISFEIGKD